MLLVLQEQAIQRIVYKGMVAVQQIKVKFNLKL